MSTLIFSVTLALGFTLIAIQNTAAVTMRLGGYAWTIPLYYMALGAFCLGLLGGWMFNLIDFFQTAATLWKKNTK